MRGMGQTEHDPRLFVHVADLHLAPRAASLPRRDRETGRLVRDLDMDRALVQAVDDVLGQDPLPSAFVIAGDVFDTWRGSIDAMLCVISQIRRLRAAGIEVIGIAGNHDTPNKQTSTSMFELLADAFAGDDGVELAYSSIVRKTVGDIEYVLLPHLACLLGELDEETLRPSPDAAHSVLVVHGVAAGDPSLRQMDEAKEIPIASWILDMGWDYIAFGHYHKPGWIDRYEGKASYCGSLENTVVSGPDVCMERGPVYVDLSVDGPGKRVMHPLPIRSIVNLPAIELGADGIDPEPDEVDSLVAKAIAEGDTSGAIVRLTVRNIARSTYQALPRRSFGEEDPSALAIRVEWEFAAPAPTRTVVVDEETGEETVIEEPVGEDGQEGAGELLPLEKEAQTAVETLVANGTIPASKKDAVMSLVLDAIVG